jgi:hypothetical protein
LLESILKTAGLVERLGAVLRPSEVPSAHTSASRRKKAS